MQVLFAYFSWSDTYYLIGVWLDEDQRTNTIKTHVLKRLHYVLNFYELLHTQVGNTNSGEPVYPAKESTNMQFRELL